MSQFDEVETVPHPVTGTPCKFTPSPQGMRRQYRNYIAQARKELKAQPVKHHKEGIMERGAAKILGLCSSHIHATIDPNNGRVELQP